MSNSESTKTFAQALQEARWAERAGAWDDALDRYDHARALLEGVGGAPAAEVLRALGRVRSQRGDIDEARGIYTAYLRMAEDGGLSQHVVTALNGRATVEQMSGAIDLAEHYYSLALAAAESVGDSGLIAMVEQNRGTLANIRGDVGTALARYQAALTHYRSSGDELAAAHALNNMGMAYVDLEDWRAAAECFSNARSIAGHMGERALYGTIELNFAELHLKQQRYEEARASCDEAARIFGGMRAKSRLGEAYKLYGVLYRETSKPQLAHSHLAQARGLAEACGDRLLQAETQSEWALLFMEEHRVREALQSMNRAHRLFSQLQAERDLREIERRRERLRGTYVDATLEWASSLETDSVAGVGHAARVAGYARGIGQTLGLGGWDLTWLEVGAAVHDVGKSALPREILRRDASRNAGEDEIMRSHFLIGVSMLNELGFPAEVHTVVCGHHQRRQGSGADIPLPGRILTVANRLDVLMNGSPRQPALAVNGALQVLEAEAGTRLDRAVVAAVPAALAS